MNAAIGWGLAVAAVAMGYAGYGWPGVALALTVTVFWLLLQFSRALRVMRIAAQNPVGHVASAVMLNARLHAGMRLPQVLVLTHSLGRKAGDEPEAFVWQDATGDQVRIELHEGRLSTWQLSRGPVPADVPASVVSGACLDAAEAPTAAPRGDGSHLTPESAPAGPGGRAENARFTP